MKEQQQNGFAYLKKRRRWNRGSMNCDVKDEAFVNGWV